MNLKCMKAFFPWKLSLLGNHGKMLGDSETEFGFEEGYRNWRKYEDKELTQWLGICTGLCCFLNPVILMRLNTDRQ